MSTLVKEKPHMRLIKNGNLCKKRHKQQPSHKQINEAIQYWCGYLFGCISREINDRELSEKKETIKSLYELAYGESITDEQIELLLSGRVSDENKR